MLIQQWSGVVCIDPTLGQFFLQQCRSICQRCRRYHVKHSTAKN